MADMWTGGSATFDESAGGGTLDDWKRRKAAGGVASATGDVSAAQGSTPTRAPMAMGDTQAPTQKPQTADSTTAKPAAPQQTFAQMQAAGIARPAPPQTAPQPGAGQPGAGQPAGGFQGQVQSALSNTLPPAQNAQREALRADLESQFQGQQRQLDEEMARRGIGASSIAGGYSGDLRGQQARALASADADLLAQSSRDAEQTRQFDLQQALAEKLGLGNLGLQERALTQSGEQFDKTFGLSQEIQRGNLTLAQAQQALNEKVQTGQLSIAQAQQALAELQNQQQFGLQTNAQNIQQQQFQQQLEQALALATMSDKTANRGIDVQGKLAENNLWMQVAALLAQMGYSPANKPPGSSPPPSGGGSGYTPPQGGSGGENGGVIPVDPNAVQPYWYQ